MKTISIIVPCYNEEKNLETLVSSFENIWKDEYLNNFNLELVLIDDGSVDKTSVIIHFLSKKFNFIKPIYLSKNFGKEIAVTAGIVESKGDCCLVFDADLQYPIEKIPEFVQKWEEGYEVVVGIRNVKREKNIFSKLGSFFFYKVINSISDQKLIAGALDFRLIDKKIIEAFKNLPESNRMTRSLIDWLGFSRATIYYNEKYRNAGQASYSFRKRFSLAFNTIISQTAFPLILVLNIGLTGFILSGIIGSVIFVGKYIFQMPYFLSITNPVSLSIFITFLVSLNMFCTGLVGLYVMMINLEVRKRPLYVKRDFNEKLNC
jgi:glycosyltransferase involved in cell wall biosynthesis